MAKKARDKEEFTRSLDVMGRFVVPNPLRERLGWNSTHDVKCYIDESGTRLIIEKVEPTSFAENKIREILRAINSDVQDYFVIGILNGKRYNYIIEGGPNNIVVIDHEEASGSAITDFHAGISGRVMGDRFIEYGSFKLRIAHMVSLKNPNTGEVMGGLLVVGSVDIDGEDLRLLYGLARLFENYIKTNNGGK